MRLCSLFLWIKKIYKFTMVFVVVLSVFFLCFVGLYYFNTRDTCVRI